MVIILEIESYELYHIGNKLNPATNFDSLKTRLKDKLKGAAGYSTTEKTFSGEQIVLDYSTEVLATKSDVRVELNRLAQALNVIGTKPDEVAEIFRETSSFIPDIGYELNKLSLFYEILASIVIKSDKKPTDILSKSVSLNLASFNINDIPDMDITAVRIGGENTAKGSTFSLSIQPNPTSPSSRFLIKFQYRSKDKETIESFHRDLDSKIIDLIIQLERT